MKGTIYCTKCGTANTADANFCFQCGQSITKANGNVDSNEELNQVEEPASIMGQQPPIDTNGPKPIPSRQPKSYNFIAKHWRGGYSLGVSYWLFGVLITVFMTALGQLSSTLSLGTRMQGAGILTFYIFILAVSVWQIVGMTRSATAHVSRGGRQFWATAANVMIFIGAIRLFYSFAVDGIPLIREGVDMVRGKDDIPPYSLRLMRNNTELELAGGIPFGTTDAVRNLLDSAPTVRVIHLNSVGGRIAEASTLADLITQRQLITYTRTSCSSACALAFLAGKERYLGEQGRIGFHSASLKGSTGSDELNVNASFRQALSRVGASQQFVVKAITTSPQNMWFPTTQELKQQNIITSVVDSSTYGLSGISNWRDAHAIEQSLMTVPLYAALATYDADNYAKIKKIMVEGVQSGRSTAEIQKDIRGLINRSLLPHYLRQAPDLALIRYWRSQIAELKFFGRTNPSHCVTFLGLDTKTSVADMTAKLPKDLASEDIAALTEVVKQTATTPMKPFSSSSYANDLKGVMITMMAKDRRAVEIIANPKKFSNDPKATCNGMILMYDTILALPDTKKAAGVLRSMAQEAQL
ncbi:zinc-ribbon domain-containing protein [Pseudomonas silesiensis]|uniref:zinc-ribbon domain-containing protein n=1 Tax=Pseudomonas silesiensis TaxID=1853130 RepID=UPI0030CE3E28